MILRPERPHDHNPNLRAKEAENRSATRDQAPLEGEIVSILPLRKLACSNVSFSTNQTSLVSPTQRFSGASPQNKNRPRREVSRRLGLCFVSAPPSEYFGRWATLIQILHWTFRIITSLAIKPRKGALSAIERSDNYAT